MPNEEVLSLAPTFYDMRSTRRGAFQQVLGLVDFCRVSAGARTAGEVGRSATVWVIRNHHTAVCVFDAITIDTSFAATLVGRHAPQTQDLNRFFSIHLGLEAAFDPFAPRRSCGAHHHSNQATAS